MISGLPQQANICSLWVSILFKVNKGGCVVEELGSVVILHFQNVHPTLSLLLWPGARWRWRRHTRFPCHVEGKKVTGALYPFTSSLSARKGSVSCVRSSVVLLLTDLHQRSHLNVMKLNSLGMNHLLLFLSPVPTYINHVTPLFYALSPENVPSLSLCPHLEHFLQSGYYFLSAQYVIIHICQ